MQSLDFCKMLILLQFFSGVHILRCRVAQPSHNCTRMDHRGSTNLCWLQHQWDWSCAARVA
jgi:hypothetical protein